MGLGKPKKATIAFVLAGLANLVLSLALARPLGLAGVALGTAIPNVAFRSDGAWQAEESDDRVRPRGAGEPRAEPGARAAARTGRRRARHRDSKRRVPIGWGLASRRKRRSRSSSRGWRTSC